jgi:hypothetical protein
MLRIPAALAWGLAALALGGLLALQDGARPGAGPGILARNASDVQDMLQGAWLREYTADGVKVRRVLTLDANGTFQERVRAVDAGGSETRFEHEGTWLYDGTNLKRKYTLMNGKPPSRLNVPFATFEIRFETRNEFRGVDHVHRNKVLYRRVGFDERP